VLDQGDRTAVVTDDRFQQLLLRLRRKTLVPGAAGSATATAVKPVTVEKQRYINQPDGYWIAAADPQAAYHAAVTGSAPLSGP